MNDATKKMLVTVGAGIIKKLLMLQAAGLVSHGLISSNETETYVSLGMALIGALWSFWDDYGRAIVLSQLEVLKAKSLAQAQQAKIAGLPPVTVTDIAAQSRTMTPADVIKAVAKLPLENQATVAPVKAAMTMAFAAIVAASLFAFSGDVRAQTRSTTVIGTALNALATLVQNDGTASVQLSTAIPELQDYVGQACWTQIALIGKVVKAHPIPLTLKIASDIEAMRLVGMSLNKICANPNCGQMWTDVQNVANAINPTVLPVSLPSICSKIPVIATLPQSAVSPTVSAVPLTAATPASK